MPRIQITHPYKMSPSEVKSQLEALSKTLGSKYDLKSDWISNTEAKVSRTGVTGTIRIESDQVAIDLDLSFALTPLRGAIESKIKDELKALLG